jgi:hypothetical protein
MRDHACPPLVIAMIRLQAVVVIQDRLGFITQFRAGFGNRFGRMPAQLLHCLAKQREGPQAAQPSLRNRQHRRCILNVPVNAVFQKLVMPRAQDEHVRFVGQAFLQNGNQPVTRVGHSAAVDDFPIPTGVGLF